MGEESAVKVCVRVRPLIKREEEAAAAENAESVKLYWKADRQAIHQIDDDGNLTKGFAFDRVFSAEETTNQLYQDIAKPLVVSTVEGYNGTIFTYGQTSSGKTFTMMGSDHIPGVIPLAMADVFQTIKNCPKKEFLLRVSYMEIYNETVTDLLCDSWKRKPLEIREGNYKNVYVADLTEELVTSPEQALAWIRKGEKNRHYGKTKMNQRSSRSHTIFRMILESRERSDPASGENADGAIIVSHLNLVDLAGSERASQTGAEGARFKEGCNINRSLFILGQVIKKLSDESQKGFINYRDSKLTRILQNSLGGNAKTVIICTITPVTVDETLSTLQFASAAKRMKNDPHVTEVSDDGALLRRYRNEIVDLKRRLQEVSSVTKTTVTEKETLCQLLQEKDQLQREQADRIRNLTKLLVTASNVVQIQKVPKRRMTWGGKLLRSAQLVAEDEGSADMSYAEPFFKKRRADLTISEEGEDMDDFYNANEDSSLDIEMNQSNITMRSYAYGMSPDSPQLMNKVESLERQLETETQGKQQAEEKSLALEQKMEDLEKQLQMLEQKLEVEVQEKQKSEEKCSELSLKVAELEKPSEQEKTSNTCENCKYFGETLQLCETLNFERESISTERDLLKQTLELLTEDIERLKQENKALCKDKEALIKDKETLLKDIEEQNDADEFERLEEESKKDYERELEAEISTLKRASMNAEDLVQKLKADLEAMSVQLKKKDDVVAELQTMSGKDLVQEVTRLRRSLDDAEGLSLETKKEWAFLRSENLSLKERDVSLTAEYERMENQVKSLQNQLDHEKSRFKKMQTDLQKELLGAFDENTKLTALLDGKVPKNVLDSVTLERTVADIRKELEKSQESAQALQHQVEGMKALEFLPAQVEDLSRQVSELNGELCSVQEERDSLVSAQATATEEIQRLKEEAEKAQEGIVKLGAVLADVELKDAELSQQNKETLEQLAVIQAEREHQSKENSSLVSALEEASQKATQLSEELESLHGERDGFLSKQAEDMQTYQKELESLRLVMDSTTEERDQLQEKLQTLKEERDQLKIDMEENVEMMIENQEELRTSLEKSKAQEDRILQLEAQIAELGSKLSNSDGSESKLIEELQNQMKQLQEELQSVNAERDNVLSEKPLHLEELQRMQTHITSLTEERDQLQEITQGLREEKTQLKREMEEKEGMMKQLQEELQSVNAERDNVPSEKPLHLEELQRMQTHITSLTEERDQLQEITQGLREEKAQLKREMEEKEEMIICFQLNKEQLADSENQFSNLSCNMTEEKEPQLQQMEDLKKEAKHLTEENAQLRKELQDISQKLDELTAALQAVQGERDCLLTTKTTLSEEMNSLKEEIEKTREDLLKMESELVDSQLKEAQLSEQQTENSEKLAKAQAELEDFSVEKNRLLTSLEEANLKAVQLGEALESLRHEREQLLSEEVQEAPHNPEELQILREAVKSITEERSQLQEILQALREEHNQLKRDLEESNDMMTQLREDMQCVTAEKDCLLAEKAESNLTNMELESLHANVLSLTEERDQLLEVLQGLREEKSKLKVELEEKDEMIQELKQLQAADKARLLMKDASCSIASNDSGSSFNVNEEGGQFQELLQGVREDMDSILEFLEDGIAKHAVTLSEEHQAQISAHEQSRALARRADEAAVVQFFERELVRRTASADRQKAFNQHLLDKYDSAVSVLKSSENKSQHSLKELQRENLALLPGQNTDPPKTVADLLQDKQCLLLQLQQAQKQMEMTQLREDMQCVTAEKDCLLAEKAESNLTNMELESLHANVLSLTEERDQLLEVLQGLREEKSKLKVELEEKDEMIQELKQLQAADKARLLMKDASCSIASNDSGSSFNVNEEGGQFQELLQGVRELIQVQSELKQQKRQGSEQLSPGDAQEAQLQQMQVLKEEVESLRNERTVLRKDLQEAAEMSKTYQDLLHSTKEELKQQQKENAELMTQSTEKESQLRQQLNQLSEDLLSLRGLNDQLLSEKSSETQDLNTELQSLQTRITSLEKEKETLDEMLKESEGKRQQLAEELESLGGIKDQLLNEKTHAEQLLEVLNGVREERSQLSQELQEKVEKLAHIEEKVQGLEKQKLQLETEVNTLSQSLQEANAQTDVASKRKTLMLVSEMETSNEKLKAAFMKLQRVIDRPTPVDPLADDIRKEWPLLHQLVAVLPKSQRAVCSSLTSKTNQLHSVLGKTGVTLKTTAQRHKAHFMAQIHRDVASFEERRLQDVLIRQTQAPSRSVQMVREDLQEIWDQRLLELLGKRKQCLQDMDSILEFLEDGIAKHAVTLSEEHQAQISAHEQSRALARRADEAAVVQFFERELVRRTALADRQKAFNQHLLDKYDSAVSVLKSSENKSQHSLKELQRENLALLPGQNTDPPKTVADLLQDKQCLLLQLQQAQKQMEMTQLREDMQCVTAEKDCLLAEKAESNLTNMELESLHANVLSLTEERDQLLEVLQGLREEKSKLKVELEEKDEMIQELKQLQAADKARLLMKDASCSIASNDSGSSFNVNEEGGKFQELLQGVREDMDSILEFLEDGIAKHAVTL
ncbi:centromere-associated protein E-like isoform X3 [Astyanax mexicanus]|uniref:centromere-associated protein E-like isoform X3 n=1 Tax=Astyanax mexicanus TaxID=7994 RepID=UPI0020CB32B8|nr:centromere-associated protein E-like isoform X3 [Astyanax mexicanus]